MTQSPVHDPGSAIANRPCILVVDDEEYVRRLLCRWLASEGYDCSQASNGEDAWKALQENDFPLMITDIMMPGMSGMALLSRVQKRHGDMAVIMVTAVDDRETATRALQLGAYGYIIKPLDQNEVLINVANALERRRLVLASEEYEQYLEEKVSERTAEVRRREEEITLRLVSASEYRDEETGTHIRRMGLCAATLAKALGWDARATADIRLAAPMHDIGKIGIPDGILLKPGKLATEEFETMKKHAEIGANIMSGSDVALLQMAADIALSHHEKWDGSGYPGGLSGEEIPEAGRIVAVLDVYDALVHDRPYRPALPEEEALAIITKGKGQHFDPELFECFLHVLPGLRRIRQEVGD